MPVDRTQTGYDRTRNGYETRRAGDDLDPSARMRYKGISMADERSTARVYELRISLRDVEPDVWRRLRVRSDVTLSELHRTLQIVMGWQDTHLHRFHAGDQVYGPRDPEYPEQRDERRAVVADVMTAGEGRLVYEYDFGDGWSHDVVLERIFDPDAAETYPNVVDGRRSCPPEDCGGPLGYEDLLHALANPRQRRNRELVEWVGESFDPEAFTVEATNRALLRGRGRRRSVR